MIPKSHSKAVLSPPSLEQYRVERSFTLTRAVQVLSLSVKNAIK